MSSLSISLDNISSIESITSEDKNAISIIGVVSSSFLKKWTESIGRMFCSERSLTPNAKTRTVLENTDRGIGLIPAKNIDDLFEQLGI